MGQAGHEPSMEDILASIKRIIAEDSEAAGARPPRLRREAMAAVSASPVVMPLRPPVEPEPEPETDADQAADAAKAADETAEEPAAIEPEAEAEPDEEPAQSTDILELTSPMSDTAAAAAAPMSSALADGLLSTTSEQASRAAFAALSQMQVRSDQGQSNTLEGLVADLLKPMLREWLDRELPSLVERLVSAEVKRLAGG